MGVVTFFKNLFGNKTEDSFTKFNQAKEKINSLQKEIEELMAKEIGDKKELYQTRIDLLKRVSRTMEIARKKHFPNKTDDIQNYAFNAIKNSGQTEQTKRDNYKIPDYGAEASVIIAESYLPKKDGRKEEFLLFFRKDLTDSSTSKPFEEIDYHDLYTSSITTMQLATMLVFVDDNGNTKILKNRYGKDGIVK